MRLDPPIVQGQVALLTIFLALLLSGQLRVIKDMQRLKSVVLRRYSKKSELFFHDDLVVCVCVRFLLSEKPRTSNTFFFFKVSSQQIKVYKFIIKMSEK